MINTRRLYFGRFIGILLWVAVALWSGPGQAADSGSGEQGLRSKYSSIGPAFEKSPFDAPIHLESTESKGTVRVDMYGIFNYSFDAISEAVSSPSNWCDITALHINVKACVSTKAASRSLVTIYSGRKHYQPPADAYPLKLNFRVVSRQPTYLDVMLLAKEGPLGTKDHRIRLEATPLDSGRTLVHFSYTYGTGSVTRMAVKSYLSTLGRDKVGFSVVSQKNGKPAYVHGVKGALERNTVRYYLALQAYMDTLKYPGEQRFEQRISRWYDLTAKYPRQLKEMEKSEYLKNKRLELRNQIALQKKAGK